MQNFLRFIDQNKISVFTLAAFDLLFFLLSFFSAYYLRNWLGTPIQPVEVYIKALPVSFLILVIVFYFFGLYEQKIRIEGTSEVYTVTKAVLMTAVLLMAGSFLYKYDYSRGFVIIFIFSGLFFLNFGRLFIRSFRKWLITKGIGLTRVAIVGAGRPGKRLAEQIEKYRDFGYRINKILNSHNNLSEIIERENIDLVFVSDPNIAHNKILEMMTKCENMNVRFKLVSGLYEILAGNIDIHELEGIPGISMKSKKSNILFRATKRLMDIVLSALGLIIFAPLWILIVAGIKLDSPGKALIKQKRVGKDGGIFEMYKFRTMKNDTGLYEKAPFSPDDPRITKFGKFLRKTSLDELPQLINVLKGEMSLVGPRPEMPFIVENYSNWQRKRLEVKPGLTGLWQILGRKDLPLHENIEYDFYYIKNQSLILDMVILVKTVWTVIRGKGAF
jgi:exopolysaccharide biosynthesis polyprenyl glycosylphosphotransferase